MPQSFFSKLPRLATLAALILVASFAGGQGGKGLWDNFKRTTDDAADLASGKSVFQVAKPDIVIQIYKHKMGADMFEINAVNPNYPTDLLMEQVHAMCTKLGVPARGLRAGKDYLHGDPKFSFIKATFATDGVIDREKGVLRITPIIQAFAGAPAPFTVHAIMISFNGEKPTANVLKSYSTAGMRLQAIANTNPPVIEYRIQLLSQDLKTLEVPDTAPPEQNLPPTTSSVQKNGVDWSLWVALVVAAAAAGVLVYFFMLRTGAKSRR